MLVTINAYYCLPSLFVGVLHSLHHRTPPDTSFTKPSLNHSDLVLRVHNLGEIKVYIFRSIGLRGRKYPANGNVASREYFLLGLVGVARETR